MSSTKSAMILGLMSLAGVAVGVGCEHHHHHDDVEHVEIVDEHGFHHTGYYGQHRDWHGGYYDEHHTFHDDPAEWHR